MFTGINDIKPEAVITMLENRAKYYHNARELFRVGGQHDICEYCLGYEIASRRMLYGYRLTLEYSKGLDKRKE